jgi:hypothetical protein
VTEDEKRKKRHTQHTMTSRRKETNEEKHRAPVTRGRVKKREKRKNE